MTDWANWEGWGFDTDGNPVPIPNAVLPDGVTKWTVVCTDAGQHTAPIYLYTVFDRRKQLDHSGIVSWGPSAAGNKSIGESRRQRKTNRASMVATVAADGGVENSPTLRVKCPSCGRDKPFSTARLAKIFDALGDSTGRRLDISAQGV